MLCLYTCPLTEANFITSLWGNENNSNIMEPCKNNPKKNPRLKKKGSQWLVLMHPRDSVLMAHHSASFTLNWGNLPLLTHWDTLGKVPEEVGR